MVRSQGQGKASASKSKSKKLVLVSGEAELSKCSVEDTVDDTLDEVENNKNNILDEGSLDKDMKNEVICESVDGNGHEEVQIGNQVNDEEKGAVDDISIDKSENVLQCGQTVEVAEEVCVGFSAANSVDEERTDEVLTKENSEQIHYGFVNKGTEGEEEMKTMEVASQGHMNIDEGASASDYGILEETSKVDAVESMGTPADDGKIESACADASISNDVKSVTAKTDKPTRKILKKKILRTKKKTAILVEDFPASLDEANSKSLTADEESVQANKVDTGVDGKGEDSADTRIEKMSSELADNVQKEEVNRVDAGEVTGCLTVDRKMECGGDAKSITEKTDKPKRKVLKKKVVKKKAVLVQDDLASMDESKLQSLTGNEVSDVADKADTDMDVKSEEKVVPAGDDASLVDDVKAVPQKVDRPQRKILKKRAEKEKVVVQNEVTPMEAAKLQSLIGSETSGETNTADANENEDKIVPADKGKLELKGKKASTVDSVKATPQKTNVLEKKMSKIDKVTLKGTVASVNTAGLLSVENNASGEGNQTDTHKEKNDDKAEVKTAVKLNSRKRRRKRPVKKGNASMAIAVGEQRHEVVTEEVGNKENKQTGGRDLNGKEGKFDDGSSSKKGKKKKMKNEDSCKVIADGITNPGPSENSKSSGSIGMIFMCSSETMKDCYHYKVFGLPGNKKDVVSKICEGMRLFLFDVTQRKMHGIYKASSHGGYNIEPRAFNSNFPSQVRFSVVEDCLPLPEEKFKKVIKDNYYKGNRFRCELTPEQVKDLCKLFTENGKRKERNPPAKIHISSAPSSSRHDRKRKRDDKLKVEPKRKRVDKLKVELKRKRDDKWKVEPKRKRADKQKVEHKWAREEVRHAPIVIDDRYHHHRPVVYERESYLPSPVRAPVYQHLPVQNTSHPSYSYDHVDAPRVAVYRRDVSFDHRQRDLHSSLVSYVPYRETPAYREPVYETSAGREVVYEGVYREPLYESSVRREPAIDGASGSHAEYYIAANYRAPLPPYRRY